MEQIVWLVALGLVLSVAILVGAAFLAAVEIERRMVERERAEWAGEPVLSPPMLDPSRWPPALVTKKPLTPGVSASPDRH